MTKSEYLEVNEEFFDSDGDLTTYEGSPFTGIGFDLFEDGVSREYETPYKDGLPHGVCRHWFSNGQIAFEIECKNGLTHGVEKHWYDNGELKSEADFELGIKLRSRSWDESGNLVDAFELSDQSENFKLLQKMKSRAV